jgi:hypothetical protein
MAILMPIFYRFKDAGFLRFPRVAVALLCVPASRGLPEESIFPGNLYPQPPFDLFSDPGPFFFNDTSLLCLIVPFLVSMIGSSAFRCLNLTPGCRFLDPDMYGKIGRGYILFKGKGQEGLYCVQMFCGFGGRNSELFRVVSNLLAGETNDWSSLSIPADEFKYLLLRGYGRT